MKVIAYQRVSTEEQAKSGLGLEAQQRKIEAYCQLYELDIVETITDAGFSGKNLKRPGIQKALALLKAGKADGLVVAKLDRLSRSVLNISHLVGTVFTKKRLFSVGEQIDGRSAIGRFMLTIHAGLAELERATIGERTSAALVSLRQRGKKAGGAHAPFGYDADESGNLTPRPAEQKTIALARQWRSEGISLRGIAAKLDSRGIKTKSGSSWKASQVARILEEKVAS